MIKSLTPYGFLHHSALNFSNVIVSKTLFQNTNEMGHIHDKALKSVVVQSIYVKDENSIRPWQKHNHR